MSAHLPSAEPEDSRRPDPAQLHVLADLTPVMLMRCDAAERYVFVNRAYAEHRGRRAEDIVGRTVREIVGEENYRIILPHLCRVLAGESVQYEATIHYQARGPRAVAVSYEPERDHRGVVRGWVSAITDVTAMRESQQKLDELVVRIDAQARLFDATLSHIADLAYTFDREARVIYANQPLLDLWGIKLAEAVGKNCFDLNYPIDLAKRLDAELRSVIETGQTVHGVTELTSAAGVIDVHEYIYNPVYDPHGKIVAVAGTTRLITERRRIETALRESEQKLSQIMALMPVGVYSCDSAGRITFYNRRAAELWGREPELMGEQIKFCGCFKVFHPDGTFISPEATPMAVALREGRSLRGVEATVERPDGSRFTASVNIDPVYGSQGELVGAINVFQDITESKAAEIASRRLSAIVEWSDDAIISKNLDGTIVTWNHGAERLFGYKAEEIIGRPIVTLIPENRIDEEPGILQRIRQGIPIEHYETIRRRKDGTEIPISLTVSPIRDSTGKIVGASKIARDITEQKRTEADLKHSRDEAERANRAKDQFLAALSHELRTPLTPVLMAVGARQIDPTLSPALQADFAMIRRNVELETKLIDDLLDLNRITTGKLNLRLESVSLNEVVHHVAEICRSPIREKDIQFECRPDPTDPRVRADSARLQQVLWNLLKNAEKFTPIRGQITLQTETEGSIVRVTITDSGAGIAPDVLPRIFNAFEQGDARVTRQFGGLGLGLAISQALMELHGGSIQAESEGVGLGSKFMIQLPREPVSAEPVPSESRPINLAANQTLRVLIAEDHPDTILILAQLMKGWGHEVTVAGSVGEALDWLRRQKFDILVSDLGLPDATGYDLMKQALAIAPLKGIAMSGYGMEEDIRKSLEAGFSEHLVKPVNLGQLERLIQTLGRTES